MQTLIKRLPIALAIVILVVMTGIIITRGAASFSRSTDAPPTIEFTWSPAGTVSLQDLRGHIHITDDHALNFKTYKMTLVEAKRTLPFPLADQIIGKEYDDDRVYFSLLANDPQMSGKDKLTVQIEIADDAGQKTSIERVINIKPPAFRIDPTMQIK
ncbi:MAG: hypothetical protein RLZZ324_1081 [Candidatus Parcubacteria bacterium]|jgi:hypothetical protein